MRRYGHAWAARVAGFGLTIAAMTTSTADAQSPSEVYDPYPPGIVPTDLLGEIDRVRHEIRSIFEQDLEEAEALGPISRAGNPPVLAGNGYDAMRLLGDLLNFDENMSVNGNQACGFCHMPYTGFSGPIPSVNLTMVGYPGSVHVRANNRTPMRYSYASKFPVLQYNEVQGDFFGGNFWDGRATGLETQNPNAEQASDPPVGAVEQGFPDSACIAYRLSQAAYRNLFEAIWGAGSLDIAWPPTTEEICSTPAGAAVFGDDATPVPLTPEQRTRSDTVFRHWGQTLSFYQSAADVSPFTSKFDAYLAGNATLTDDELAGYKLFRGKGNCNSCHLDGVSTLLEDGQVDTGDLAAAEPLFTDFTYVNIGLPLNPRVALYYETTPDAYGFTPNPAGFGLRDLGVGNFLRSVNGVNPNTAWIALAPDFDGKMQVMTARNAAMTPTQCPTTEAGQVDGQGQPVPYFQKGFFHNGYIKSLKQLVHFYNTRDLHAYPVTSGNCPAGTTEKVDCWPMPEVPNNMDTTIGDLGLSDQEEDQIVAFLQTLTDGYTTPYPHQDAFAGTCQTGGSAATQGNETLIATPALPPCPPELCEVAPLPQPPIP
ncbi:MAG: cytochrome c peroxidase [Pseudomonadota bacterium]